jgi:hypothetical protein
MKLLTFQARRFAWKSHSKTLAQAADDEVAEDVRDAVVAFVHAEAEDGRDRARVLRHALKHLKWIANKRELRRVVLHSFTHLGAESAPPELAGPFLEELAARLRETGYEVWTTPFGWFCEWELAVHGESLAKVWKEVRARDAEGGEDGGEAGV